MRNSDSMVLSRPRPLHPSLVIPRTKRIGDVFVLRCVSKDGPMHVGAADTFRAACIEAQEVMSQEDWDSVAIMVAMVFSDPGIEELKIPGRLMIQKIPVKSAP